MFKIEIILAVAAVIEQAAIAAMHLPSDEKEAWCLMPEWQKETARKMAMCVGAGHGIEKVHDIRRASLLTEGWKFGTAVNSDKREHPCLVDFSVLDEKDKMYYVDFSQSVLSVLKFRRPDSDESQLAYRNAMEAMAKADKLLPA